MIKVLSKDCIYSSQRKLNELYGGVSIPFEVSVPKIKITQKMIPCFDINPSKINLAIQKLADNNENNLKLHFKTFSRNVEEPDQIVKEINFLLEKEPKQLIFTKNSINKCRK